MSPHLILHVGNANEALPVAANANIDTFPLIARRPPLRVPARQQSITDAGRLRDLVDIDRRMPCCRQHHFVSQRHTAMPLTSMIECRMPRPEQRRALAANQYVAARGKAG